MLYSTWNTKDSGWWGGILHSPISCLWSGSDAVIMFFVLSGFVLTIPFLKKPRPYKTYVIKRVLRIYPPYLVMVIAAIILRYALYEGKLSEYSDWFNRVWSEVSVKDVIGHFILIGTFNSSKLVPVFWTLGT